MIKHLANNKAQGPDGELYKSSQDILNPTLLEVFKGIWSDGPYLLMGYQTFIKLIAKNGEDPLEPGFYLNLDVKILSEMVATYLANILLSLIHTVQLGFVADYLGYLD